MKCVTEMNSLHGIIKRTFTEIFSQGYTYPHLQNFGQASPGIFELCLVPLAEIGHIDMYSGASPAQSTKLKPNLRHLNYRDRLLHLSLSILQH